MGNGIESEADGAFLLTLTLAPEGKVTGQVSSQFGDGALEKGTFDAETGAMHAEITSDGITVVFEAKVEGNSMAGTMAESSGLYDYAFNAARPVREGVEAVEASVAAAPQMEAEPEADEAPAKDSDKKKKEKKRKLIDDTIDQLLPDRFHVSSIQTSQHEEARVYVTFDGHRSDDDRPWVFVSEDHGTTWESLRANLPDAVGSARVIAEDPVQPNLLFLGCEHGAFVSIDRGESWTRFGNDLPTVPVHDFAIHPSSGELIVGTHGRSVWIADISMLRNVTEETLEETATLLRPSDAVIWRSTPSRGSSGTRSFTGENPPSRARIYYSLRRKSRDVSMVITGAGGEVIRELSPSVEKGLHVIEWDLRGQREEERNGRRRRSARRVDPGTYLVELRVGEETWKQPITVALDPQHPDVQWLEFEREAERCLEERIENGLEREYDL